MVKRHFGEGRKEMKLVKENIIYWHFVTFSVGTKKFKMLYLKKISKKNV